MYERTEIFRFADRLGAFEVELCSMKLVIDKLPLYESTFMQKLCIN